MNASTWIRLGSFCLYTSSLLAQSAAPADRDLDQKARLKYETRQRLVTYRTAGQRDVPDAPEGGPNNCCEPIGTPGCDDPDCEAAVCAVDAFCCLVWDRFCVSTAEAFEECACSPCGVPSPCSAMSGGCCDPQGTPGCNDVDCCECVCAQDPFCCRVAWDRLCVAQISGVCSVFCKCSDPGCNCCFPTGNLGCDNPECQMCVCAQDPFCCDIAWDDICVSRAMGVCAGFCACCNGPPEGGPNDCCVPANGGVGCCDNGCEACVCGQDPFCCDIEWDGVCANEAIVDCACTCPSPCTGGCPGQGGDCCLADGTPGCDDVDCCGCVCGQDPFCCEIAWDAICVGSANGVCAEVCNCSPPPPPPENDNCGDRILIDDGATPFSTLGATTDGPPHPECQKGLPDPQVNQDIWYNWNADCTGPASADTSGSGFDSKLAVYGPFARLPDGGCASACPIDPATLLCCNDDYLGTEQSQVEWDAVRDACYKIRVGGFGTAVGDGVLNVSGMPLPDVAIVSANPPLDNPFVPGIQAFVDPLQNRGSAGGFGSDTLQGIGDPGLPQATPNEGTFTYSTISFTTSSEICVDPDSFTVVCAYAPGVNAANAGNSCPSVTSLTELGGAGPTYQITLSGPIPAGACTSITLAGVTGSLTYGFLPGDVSGNGTASAADVLLLINLKNGRGCPLGPVPPGPSGDWGARCDINRSGSNGATDELRAVGLLNGLNTVQPWLNINLPAPCP